MRYDAYRLVGAMVLVLLQIAPLTAHARPAADGVTEDKVNAAVPRLETLITEEMQKTGVPGIAVGIVYRDKPIYLKAADS